MPILFGLTLMARKWKVLLMCSTALQEAKSSSFGVKEGIAD